MTNGWSFLLLSVIFCLKIEPTFAIYYIEPGIGAVSYGRSVQETVQGVSSQSTGTSSGFAGGAKVGVRQDYVHVIANLNYLNIAGNLKDEIYGSSGFEYGAALGWEWSIPILTTAGFSSTSLTGNGSTTTTSGFKMDLGYFFTEDTKINLTYMNLTSEEEKQKIANTLIFAMLSFPFEFEYRSGHWRTKK